MITLVEARGDVLAVGEVDGAIRRDVEVVGVGDARAGCVGRQAGHVVGERDKAPSAGLQHHKTLQVRSWAQGWGVERQLGNVAG
eukprot:364228-Chlamydomonas_euryale.AAC.23